MPSRLNKSGNFQIYMVFHKFVDERLWLYENMSNIRFGRNV